MRITNNPVLSIVLTLSFSACNQEPQPPSQLLRGISTTTVGKTIVFVGSAPDLKIQLQETVAGIVKDERWYRFDIPESKMPALNGKLSVDLADNEDVAIAVRLPDRAPMPINKDFYHTIVLGPSSSNVTGTLQITAPTTNASSNVWSVSFEAVRKGPVTLGGKVYADWESNIRLGLGFNPVMQ